MIKDKLKTSRTVLLISALLLFLFTSSSVVSAVYLPRIMGESTSTPSAKAKNNRDETKERLSTQKLQVCQKKETVIRERSRNLVRRAENIQNRFDTIVERVDTFYIDKVVPGAGEITNYQDMLNTVTQNRRMVASSLGLAKSTAENFSCEGKDPKKQIKQFRSDMSSVIKALKEYKESVINLLVAVKTKAKNIKAPTATESAKPATSSAGKN